MKARHIIILMTSLFCITGVELRAQDPHFSQYYNSPLYQNPSLTGNFPGQYRFQLNYRSQWNSVTVPFQTMMAAFDMTPTRRVFRKDRMSAGFTVLRDKAGDSDYGIFVAGINMAYHLTLNRKATNILSFGVQAGFAQRSINYAALRFPGQFDGSVYDPGLGNGENFSFNNLAYTDLGSGITWSFSEQKTRYQFGISANHLNRPALSFMENVDVRLEPRVTIQGQVSFPLDENWEMIPSFQVENQDHYNKVLLGSLFKFDNPIKSGQGASFYGGVFTRLNDAAILAAGLEYSMYNFCVSYDINYSSLHPASAYQGGFEISLAMIMHKQSKKIRREISCPVF